MRKNPPCQSGIFTPRILFAFSLFSIGVLLALFSLSARPMDGSLAARDDEPRVGPGHAVRAMGMRSFLPKSRSWPINRRSNPSTMATGAWSIVPSPNVNDGVQYNYLSNVACSSASDCWAVGTHIQHWDGVSWSIAEDDLNPSSPDGDDGTLHRYLQSVTCLSTSECWAAGYYYDPNTEYHDKTLIEHWNGVSWSVVASPNASVYPNYLSGITCLAASDCWAVGNYDVDGNEISSTTLAEHWNGSSWSIIVSPNPSPGYFNFLDGVTCSSASDCWAVGRYSIGGVGETLMLRWNGASWTVFGSPNQGALYSVACVSAADCWAVGSTPDSSNDFSRSLLLHWNGSSWVVAPAPDLADSHLLYDVTCLSGSDCWAVGRGPSDGTLEFTTLVEHWDGSSWSIVDSPNRIVPGGGGRRNTLTGVVCSTASGCWGVGYYSAFFHGKSYTYERRQTLILQWNGVSWALADSPNVNAAQRVNFLSKVACASPSDCWAVGHRIVYNDYNEDYDQALVEHWNGQSWSVVELADISPAYGNTLKGVTCVSSSDCWAVGSRIAGSTLAEHWDGTAWSIVDSPNVRDEGNELLTVTCISSSDCWAVGDLQDFQTGYTQTLIQHWNGNSWLIVPSPNANPQLSSLSAVTCSSDSNCWAVGSYQTGAGISQTLIERWDGTAWSIVPSPNTNPSQTNVLYSVTCPSGSDCWAVGQYQDSSLQTLIERWNGVSWQIIPSANTGAIYDNRLLSVTCSSPSQCWAVGSARANNIYQTLIEKWDGNTWAIVSSPNGGNSGENSLAGASCASGVDCWAVGYYSGEVVQTLIEHFTAAAPTLGGVVSRRAHGGAGMFDVDLPAAGNPGVECRSGGASGDYQMVFTFANDLTSVDSASTSAGAVSSRSTGPNPNQYTVNLTGLPNGQFLTVTLNNVQDTDGNAGNVSSTMGVLIGDTNANGSVNSADVAQTKSRIGQPVDATNFRSDVNANGTINASDAAIVKSNIGSGLP